MTPLEQKKKNRFLFLELLYKESNGNTNATFDALEIGQKLKIEYDETRHVVDYLRGEDLIERLGMNWSIISLTHWGVKEVEQALENPDKPTEHFLPINIINIGTMTNSTLQQATSNSTINFQLDGDKMGDLDAVIASIKQVQDTLNISVDLKQELFSELQTLEAQRQSPKPKSNVIVEVLRSIKTIFEGAAGNMIAPVVAEQITRMIG